MDQRNQRGFRHHGIVDGAAAYARWSSTFARELTRPLRELTSAIMNHHWVFRDHDDDTDEYFRARIIQQFVYSRPFMVLDVIWNMAFVVVAVFVLMTSIRERPLTPLRLWVAGYALQSLLHLGFVCFQLEYQTGLFYDHHFRAHPTFIRRLESLNTVISSLWWLVGFYWILMGGHQLFQDSPRLYWLSVVYLGFDLFMMIFCVGMACSVFIAVFCCFPILATVAYAMTVSGGASEDDLNTLPKFNYRQPTLISHPTPQLPLTSEDPECCICLHPYEDGAELCTLPCSHHFHYQCIRKWLRISPTCPLCKYNMFHGDMLV